MSDDVTQQRRFIEGATMEKTKSVCRSEGLRTSLRDVQEALWKSFWWRGRDYGIAKAHDLEERFTLKRAVS